MCIPIPQSLATWICRLVVVCGCVAISGAHAQITFRAGQLLPFSSGGAHELIGDMVATDNGVAAVFSRPVGTTLQLMFYRFGPDAQTLVERQHSLASWNFYCPSLCWDGQNFGVVASALTQSIFLRLSPAGDIIGTPLQLPGLPTGDEVGRTAAFRVLWTGQGYAVFGLWLERQYDWQGLTNGNFYTHLNYWLLDAAGQPVTQPRELRMLAPMTYPGIEGGEKDYYDVAWTGQSFFLAYYGESQTGPPFSIYYKLFDLQGNQVRDEAPVFANQVAQGPRIAWNGQTLAVTALKAISLPDPNAGNYMYIRCYDAAGAPRAVETQYGQKLGYGPTVFWAGDKFMTAYCMMYNMATLKYTLLFNTFDEFGRKLGNEYPLAKADGGIVVDGMALGIDVRFAGGPTVIYAKAQNCDNWGLTFTPVVFTLNGDAVAAPVLAIVPDGDKIRLAWPANATGFQLQETPTLNAPQWNAVQVNPEVQNDQYTVTLPNAGTRFYRLLR